MPSNVIEQSLPIYPFQRYQRRFVRYLRERRGSVPIDLQLPARIDVYAQLLYQKFEDSLSVCFPVTKALLGGTHWNRLVEAFIAQHRCASPYYRQIPDEFVTYLNARPFKEDDPPFLNELVHYEWLELALATAQDEPVLQPFDPAGDLMRHPPVLNPLLHVQAYRWSVHRIAPELPDWDRWRESKQVFPSDQPSFILALRDARDSVRLVEINALTARLIELLREGRRSGKEVLLDLAAEARFLDLAHFIPFGEQTLRQLQNQGAILGTQAPTTASTPTI